MNEFNDDFRKSEYHTKNDHIYYEDHWNCSTEDIEDERENYYSD